MGNLSNNVKFHAKLANCKEKLADCKGKLTNYKQKLQILQIFGKFWKDLWQIYGGSAHNKQKKWSWLGGT